MKAKLRRFWLLPFLVVTLGIMLSLISVKLNINAPAPEREGDVRFVLWYLRQFDLLGQIIILLAGVFGVVILFREPKKNG
jgi:hypothetical protein